MNVEREIVQIHYQQKSNFLESCIEESKAEDVESIKDANNLPVEEAEPEVFQPQDQEEEKYNGDVDQQMASIEADESYA